ncbi:MAG: threonine--tRNA ligase [Oscillatoriales cyanobacterium]|nr:MAG: threonine--tRNA ligase [Oscillatoriales cyanobacterium]
MVQQVSDRPTADHEAKISLPKTSESETLKKIRHTTSHVMAMAVQKLFPKAQVTIGPWIENGFYYDFDSPEPFSEEALKAIKKEMIKIINKKLPVIREEVSREEAKRRIEAIGEPYKLEILDDIKTEPITLYHLGDQWWDLCAGPHLENTSEINPKAIELETVAGAYWRGDATKAQLQRIYGTAWESPEQLTEHKRRKEEALKRDHRKLGNQLDLFHFQEAAPGSVFWHARGWTLFQQLIAYMRMRQERAGYIEVNTPDVMDRSLWETSGHWQNYRDHMFTTVTEDDRVFALKPMNCPGAVSLFKHGLKSYRDLPIRMAEFGKVHRYEPSGTLHGLMRVRHFTQDDAHIFCAQEDMARECEEVVKLVLDIYKELGFAEVSIKLSTRPENRIGTDQTWDLLEAALSSALSALNLTYQINEGEGAFYGPKLEFVLHDAIGRDWQCGTLQVDLNLPERFDIEYVTKEGDRSRPVMLHRALFGSLERFIGILIEQYSGDLPFWLAPEQVRLLPVGDDFRAFAEAAAAQLRSAGVRVTVDQSGDRLGKIVRNAEKEKIPVMAVVGEKEVETNSLSLRTRADGDLGSVTVADTIERATAANRDRTTF